MENVENGSQNGSPDAVIFWSSGSFFPCQTALGASKSTQNRWKMMSVAILKKVSEHVPKIFDFLLFFKRPMCLNQSKYYIRMTFSLFADNPETYEKNF